MAFFKRPAWAKSQTVKAEDADVNNLFSHSSSFMPMQKERIERERQRNEKEKEKEQRRKEKQEAKARRSSSEKRQVKEEDSRGSFKKRRITAEDGAKLIAKAGISNAITLSDSEDENAAVPAVRRSPRTARTKDSLSPKKARSTLATSFHAGDVSENDFETTAVASRPKSQKAEAGEEVDSDPDIAELQRKARATAKLKQRQKASSSATPHVVNAAGNEDESLDEGHLPTPPPQDPAVQIFIEPQIEGTKPLIVWRKLSQTLRELRKIWCHKQNFTEEQAESIFFTFRGRKVWDATTVQRLGLGVKPNGEVYLEHDKNKESVDKVHVQAVTQGIFEEIKAEQARQARRETANTEDEQQEGGADGDEKESESQKRKVKLIIKAKDKRDDKVEAFSDTPFKKIIKHAKKHFGFTAEQEVYIEFDGERLNPDDVVGDTDLEDMDQVQMFLVK